MSPEFEITLIAVVTAVAAALPGTYLVLRRTALVSDAISHAILPGIVVAFFLTHDLSSPLLLLSAAATGVLASSGFRCAFLETEESRPAAVEVYFRLGWKPLLYLDEMRNRWRGVCEQLGRDYTPDEWPVRGG